MKKTAAKSRCPWCKERSLAYDAKLGRFVCDTPGCGYRDRDHGLSVMGTPRADWWNDCPGA